VYYLRKYSDQIDLISANAIRKVRSTGEVYDSGEPDFSGSDYRRLESAYVFNPATLFDEVLRRPFITTQAMVMHRALLDRVRFDEEIPPGPEDRAFHLELAYHQAKVAHLQSHHVTYWAHGENLSISGGLQDPSTKLPLFLAFEVATLRLNDRLRLNLTPEQRKHGRDWLVHLYFWCIGYNGYLRKGEFRSARRYFLKAIRLRPFAPSLWKTYFVSFLKQLAYRGVPARE